VKTKRKLVVSLVAILVVSFGSLGAVLTAGWSPALGLDLQGGASVVLQPTEDVPEENLEQAISIIRSRVDGLGVAEPEIARQGDAIIVSLPGVADRENALEVVGQTAELRFRPVLDILPPEGAEVPPELEEEADDATEGEDADAAEGEEAEDAEAGGGDAPAEGEEAPAEGDEADGDAPAGADAAAEDEATTPPGEVETTDPADNEPDAEVVLPGVSDEGEAAPRYRLGPTRLRGEAVDSARASVGQVGAWTVDLSMTGEGIDGFNELAADCFNGTEACPPTGMGEGAPRGAVAIELDGIVQSAPTINAATFGRSAIQISGDFTQEEAQQLALVLRFGALPVELEPQTVQTISATLGADSLRAGVIAGGIGLALVVLYMLVYYRLLGLVALVSLTLSASLLYAMISLLGETTGLALTLAGITGIVVSIGVAVDSNVVYYERLKESVLAGTTVRSASDRGFKRAFSTILRADAASLIGAVILYSFTVGPVRGFAFYLGLATVIDVVTSYFFMRPAVILMGRSRKAKRSWFGVPEPRPETAATPAVVGGR
jgi:preprotein translocase subunit SecD